MTLPPIYKRSLVPDPANPFKPDLLKRRAIAERLTHLLDRLPEGAVFAIDAPWGEGKTWFGMSWHHKLISDGYHSIYIDTFSSDYLDDPFLMLTGEISSELTRKNNPRGKEIKNAGKKVFKAIMPISTKILINTAGRVILGTTDLSKDISDSISKELENISDKVEETIDQCIELFEQEKRSVAHFQAALAEAAKETFQETKKPLVVFIDELDRCKPDYSVKTIERIKHFFDTPHLIFVLLLNKQQIHESVRGVYGPGINAELYLEKFIQFTLNLPKSSRSTIQGQAYTYCMEKLAEYGWQQDSQLAEALEMFALAFNFSLRSIERCVILLSMAAPANMPKPLSAWIAALKVGDPETFCGIINGDLGAHEKALMRLSEIPGGHSVWANEALSGLKEFHMQSQTNSQMSADAVARYRTVLGSNSMDVQTEVVNFFCKFDLALDL